MKYDRSLSGDRFDRHFDCFPLEKSSGRSGGYFRQSFIRFRLAGNIIHADFSSGIFRGDRDLHFKIFRSFTAEINFSIADHRPGTCQYPVPFFCFGGLSAAVVETERRMPFFECVKQPGGVFSGEPFPGIRSELFGNFELRSLIMDGFPGIGE